MATTLAVTDTAIFDQRESKVRSYCRNFDAVFDTASGSIVYDTERRPYVDFLAGAGALNYGHNDPDMKLALIEHLGRDGITHGLDMYTEAKRAFLASFDRLVLAPRNLPHRVQFTGPTGANAVEAALKLARKVTGRTNVIAFTNGFHGVTQGALAATGNAHHRMAPALPLVGVTRMPYDGYLDDAVDTADLLERMLGDGSSGVDPPAAVLLETVQGEGGLNVASAEWLQRIADLAHRHGAVLIVDDVQAGCGRTGSFFSFETTGIVPDMIVLSKSISGYGLPMALVLIHPELDQWLPGEHNGTFRGNTHAFITARVALEKFWSGPAFVDDVASKCALVTDHLLDIADDLPGSRRKGRGMMQGLDVGSGALAAQISKSCFDNGLIIETSGARDEVVKVLAPLTTPRDVLEHGLEILHKAAQASVSAAPLADG